jgi:ABC-2 type transporter.
MIKNLLKADLRAILSNIRWLLICVLLLGLLSFISLIHPSEEAYLLCAYFYIPLFLMIFTSTFVSGERKSGFISRLFTSPISGKEYIMEKFLLGICIGFIYLGVTLPLSVLHIVYSGSGFALIFLRYFLSAFVLIAFSSGLGIFISIISSKDDVMAQLLGFALCVIFLWMSVSFAENLKEILTKSMTPSHIFLYIFHFSPLVCIMDFLNTCHAFQAGNPLISILVPLLFVIIFLVLSYIVFKKLQNVEGHDLKIGKALIIVILLAGSVLIPPMFGNTTYSAREVNALEINPWSYMLYGGGGGVYIDHMGPVHKGIMWWGHPVEIYLEGFSDVKSLHNVTITFLSPKSFDIERFGNQRFIEFDPPELYFKELKVKISRSR